ncbi:hypothetical protein DFR67_11395 [Williamsia limnetica]|uniref:Integral membrane protein n=1 Tax=Williamsia limnetica TaxID=882452 RepID=A0A318RHR6_WILLI|nr:hypothetical protein DFR67_11395 [Williamsia limnetica]
MRRAGAIVTLEGVIAVGAAIWMVIRELMGHKEDFISGYGTAAWFAILGGGVLAGGVALLTGRRWGRAIAVVAQILLLPVAFALMTDSNLPLIGTPLLVILVAALVCLFSPSAMKWFAAAYEIDPPADDVDTAPPSRKSPVKKKKRS